MFGPLKCVERAKLVIYGVGRRLCSVHACAGDIVKGRLWGSSL